ncbi:hypothetical protein BGZ73_000141, partial [Actinomortierella ambigua]
RLAHEIARGLEFIHQENVLHRDLNSMNVLLTRHMEVRLADFGSAKVRNMAGTASRNSRSDKELKGKLRWAAPELLLTTELTYSAKSDVYRLGMVMWEMAANCTQPFRDQADDALVAQAVKNGSREVLPEDTPASYHEMVERCWHQDPVHRPEASMIVLVDDALVEAGVDGIDEPLSTSSSQTATYD